MNYARNVKDFWLLQDAAENCETIWLSFIIRFLPEGIDRLSNTNFNHNRKSEFRTVFDDFKRELRANSSNGSKKIL